MIKCKDCNVETINFGNGYCKKCYHKYYMRTVRARKREAYMTGEDMPKPEKRIWKYNPNAPRKEIYKET